MKLKLQYMADMFATAAYREYLESVGKQLVGKKAQSTILTEINGKGRKVYSPQQVITGYEIVTSCMELELMVTLGGESVFEWTLFNIKNQ